jgi:hypothetical protein
MLVASGDEQNYRDIMVAIKSVRQLLRLALTVWLATSYPTYIIVQEKLPGI